jgi:diguanylate cyclase (GGDEF)-like protein
MQVSEARALHLAFHDTLTGLPNRALLVERIDAALKTRSDERVAVLFIDLDRFKEVNDTLGHHVGDELIREFVARLALHLRRSDTIGRLGGDEFAILLRHLQSEEEAFSFCERVLESGRAPFKIAGASSTVSVSIGLAWAVGGVDRHEMLRRADIALYAGKRAGRNCYRVFSPEMDEMVKEKRLIEEELRTALADRASGLAVHYQPQFGSRNGELQGVEALVRWDHPRLGAILPAAFVPGAEECGLIDELDAWVLRKACQDARGWSGTRLAVNVSPRSFDLPGLGERMLQVLREEEFDPHRLEIEVTESILLEQDGGAAQDLQLLRSKGVRVALDDFGTGYSSLRNLQALTVDKIKIDRSFVQHLGQGVDSAAIVNAVIELGHALGLTVTAEGVETEAQREYLRAIGCDAVQGFLFTKAVPAWVISGELNELTRRGVA